VLLVGLAIVSGLLGWRMARRREGARREMVPGH